MFEMEQVLPGADPDDFDSDPILEAAGLADAGDTTGARDILAGMLAADLRSLDAHAHLGNLLFPQSPYWAINHYEVGVRIARADPRTAQGVSTPGDGCDHRGPGFHQHLAGGRTVAGGTMKKLNPDTAPMTRAPFRVEVMYFS